MSSRENGGPFRLGHHPDLRNRSDAKRLITETGPPTRDRLKGQRAGRRSLSQNLFWGLFDRDPGFERNRFHTVAVPAESQTHNAVTSHEIDYLRCGAGLRLMRYRIAGIGEGLR